MKILVCTLYPTRGDVISESAVLIALPYTLMYIYSSLQLNSLHIWYSYPCVDQFIYVSLASFLLHHPLYSVDTIPTTVLAIAI